MKKFFVAAALFSLILGCGQNENEAKAKKIEEDLKALPKLAPVQIPEGVAGSYVGTLPCDECDLRRVKMNLDGDGNAFIEEFLFRRNEKTDTLQNRATYKDSAEFILVRFENANRFFAFQKSNGTSIVYLNVEGKPYLDDTEEPYRLLRILSKVSP